LALPRGGLPVGFEVAKACEAPLDLVVVRKLGVPWQPELAMGAIASGSFQNSAATIRNRSHATVKIWSIPTLLTLEFIAHPRSMARDGLKLLSVQPHFNDEGLVVDVHIVVRTQQY